MTAIHGHFRVGPDGKVVIPVGLNEAGREVTVTVTPVDTPDTINGIPRDKWWEIFHRTAGSIDDDTFMRPTPRSQDSKVEFDD